MKNTGANQVGLWIDYSKAYIIEFRKGEAMMVEQVDSPVESNRRMVEENEDMTKFVTNNEHLPGNEHRKHNIAQKELNEFFKTLETKLLGYDDILVFGPGTAKEQFRNRIRENKGFSAKWLSVQSSDKLTENQLVAFVREFYRESNP